MKGKKGQGATEYLVLLAVVLIIALVAIALLGFFPSLAGTARITQSKAYWEGATPIAIKNYKIDGNDTSVELELQNTANTKIKITDISFDGTSTGMNGTISAGKIKVLDGTVPSGTCSEGIGDVFEFINVSITYDKGMIKGMVQTGQPFIGSCSG
jgi:hypothetical protein